MDNSNTLMFASLKPNLQADLRLFCFPYAGGGPQIFRSWPDNLPITVEVFSVELPGRGTRLRETPFKRLSLLVEALNNALLLYLDKPFVFFGHSMGALLSFELARHLRRHYGLSPSHLFVSAHRAPQITNPDPPFHHLPDIEFIDALRHFNGTPEEILRNAELMQLLLPTLRADFEVCETYVYSAEDPLACAISAFGGIYDSKTERNELAAWREQTVSSYMLRMLPGDHFFLHNARTPLLQAISQDLIRLSDNINGGQLVL